MPGCGENIILPVLCPNGPGHLFVFQYFPGGPWDRWPEINSVDEHLAHSKQLLKEYLPEMYERAKDCEPMDALAYLRGGVTPVVREPVGELPSGRLVLGLGDALVVNDPLTAPGANSAAMAAEAYQKAIRAHGDAPYDRAFMEKTFNDFWDNEPEVRDRVEQPDGRRCARHVIRVLTAGNEYPEISRAGGSTRSTTGPSSSTGWAHPRRPRPTWSSSRPSVANERRLRSSALSCARRTS